VLSLPGSHDFTTLYDHRMLTIGGDPAIVRRPSIPSCKASTGTTRVACIAYNFVSRPLNGGAHDKKGLGSVRLPLGQYSTMLST
jgi:hypothetical protein